MYNVQYKLTKCLYHSHFIDLVYLRIRNIPINNIEWVSYLIAPKLELMDYIHTDITITKSLNKVHLK